MKLVDKDKYDVKSIAVILGFIAIQYSITSTYSCVRSLSGNESGSSDPRVLLRMYNMQTYNMFIGTFNHTPYNQQFIDHTRLSTLSVGYSERRHGIGI